jgi:hypothetical protein
MESRRLRKVEAGRAEKSFSNSVARLAGLSKMEAPAVSPLIRRATELLDE